MGSPKDLRIERREGAATSRVTTKNVRDDAAGSNSDLAVTPKEVLPLPQRKQFQWSRTVDLVEASPVEKAVGDDLELRAPVVRRKFPGEEREVVWRTGTSLSVKYQPRPRLYMHVTQPIRGHVHFNGYLNGHLISC